MKVEIQISEVSFREDEVLKKFKDDWEYIRSSRQGKTHFSFYDMPIMLYTIATITSPEEHAGKIVGYAGAGEYQDILVDAGTYVLGGRATEKYDVPNVRGQGIATKLRNKRNSFAEKMSRSSRKPYFAVVPAGSNSYTENLQNRGYIPHDEEIPKWAKRRLGQKFYLVYNTHRSMKKAWRIIRGV